jgi:hypothetical protein
LSRNVISELRLPQEFPHTHGSRADAAVGAHPPAQERGVDGEDLEQALGMPGVRFVTAAKTAKATIKRTSADGPCLSGYSVSC